MKKTCVLLGALVLACTALAQKTIYDPNVETRTVSSFHAIEVSHGIHLYLSNGDEAVAVSARDMEARDQIRTEVRDGVLRIWFNWKEGKRIFKGGNGEPKAYVSYKNLDRLVAAGGADVSVEGTIRTRKLEIRITSGSDFNGMVDVDSLDIEQNSGSDVDISGRAEVLTLQAGSGSDFNGSDLITEVCTATARSGSDIDVTVNREISAEATSASDISWKGSAVVKKAKSSGAGSVSRKS